MLRAALFFPLILLALLQTGCGTADENKVDVVVIGSAETLYAKGPVLPPDARHLRGAVVDGLVNLDAEGQATPGLAERWIITDDGRSYIFRLARRNWPDGTPVTSETTRDALRSAIKGLRHTSFGLDLAPIQEVRAMAGRVVEIRLATPMPQLLLLLAQPELALFHQGKGHGQMALAQAGNLAMLTPVAPQQRGFQPVRGWKSRVRPLHLTALPADQAVARFKNGGTDIVLGGRIESLPLADTGPLSRGTVRLDAVPGLLGFRVMRAQGLLAEPAQREAIAMAIDREAMMQPFNLRGWVAATHIVPPAFSTMKDRPAGHWDQLSPEERQAEAARRIATWRTVHENTEPAINVFLPEGPGADLIFTRLQADLAAIGVTARRTAERKDTDLHLMDQAARFTEARWYLNQFNCQLKQGLCSLKADEDMRKTAMATEPAEQESLLAEAETALAQAQIYVPIGAPLRWSLVRGNVAGFAPNRMGYHPLPPFALLPR